MSDFKGAYTTGYTSRSSRAYEQAIGRLLGEIGRAHDAVSYPAPHPVRWKRWLRRPYRKTDPALFMAELHKIRER